MRQGCVLAPSLFCRAIDWIIGRCCCNFGITAGSWSVTDLDHAANAVLFTSYQVCGIPSFGSSRLRIGLRTSSAKGSSRTLPTAKHLCHTMGNTWKPCIVSPTGVLKSKTIFMVLSSWQSHCESSPGSFHECRTAPNGRRPKTKPDDLGCESACTGCQSLHPPSLTHSLLRLTS